MLSDFAQIAEARQDLPAETAPLLLAGSCGPPRLALSGFEAARACGLSERSWRRLCRAGRTLLPVRLGARCLWPVQTLWLRLGWKHCRCHQRARTQRWITADLGEPLHRVLYVLHTREHIKPAARAGRLRLYDRQAVAMVRHELNAIDARRGCREGGRP